MMYTIKTLSEKTGFSSYEIRRRVQNGTLPHVRVGAKKTKILIDEDVFTKLIAEESLNNIDSIKKNIITNIASNDAIGYDRLRKID